MATATSHYALGWMLKKLKKRKKKQLSTLALLSEAFELDFQRVALNVTPSEWD